MRHSMKWRDCEQGLEFGKVLEWVRSSKRITENFSNWITTNTDFLLALIRAADGPRYQLFVHRQLNRFKDDEDYDEIQSPLYTDAITGITKGRRYCAKLTRLKAMQAHSERNYARDARPTEPPSGYVVQPSDPPFVYHHTTFDNMQTAQEGKRGGIIAGGDTPEKREHVFMTAVSGVQEPGEPKN